MPDVSLVSPQVDDGGQFPHGPDVQLGRGDPLRDPQSRFSVRCEDPGATEASETGKKCDTGLQSQKISRAYARDTHT